MAVCPLPWLLGPLSEIDDTPRWRSIGVLRREPSLQLVVPVRDIRVMYALKQRHYNAFVASQIPHPHEYYMPMDALTAEGSADDPAVRALVGRATATANFHHVPKAKAAPLAIGASPIAICPIAASPIAASPIAGGPIGNGEPVGAGLPIVAGLPLGGISSRSAPLHP